MIRRPEFEARHGDLAASIHGLSEALQELTRVSTATVKDTAELKGWLKGTTVALSIVTSVLLVAAAVFHF